MSNEWVEISLEKERKMKFKSDPDGLLLLTNVTHYKRRSKGVMLKCDQGVVYFETDDVSYIISDCDDWVV